MSMPAIANGVVIAPPAAREPRHSLLRVGEDLLHLDGDASLISRDIDPRWEAGVQYLPEGCDSGGVYYLCEAVDFTVSTAPETVTNIPMVVWAPWTCSTFGSKATDFKKRAKRKLESVKSHWLEVEFWRGDHAVTSGYDNLYLGRSASLTIVNPAATSTPLVYAFGLLEQALSTCMNGGGGVIHVSRMVATLLESAHLIKVVPDSDKKNSTIRYYTMFGTEVIAGSGYDGSGPGQAVADVTGNTQWIYATGPVGVAEGKVIVTPETEREAMNRSTNQLSYVAARTVAATWDGCCHLGINVNLCATCCVDPLIPSGGGGG